MFVQGRASDAPRHRGLDVCQSNAKTRGENLPGRCVGYRHGGEL